MKIKYLVIAVGSLTMSLGEIASAKSTTPDKVQSALDWQLPESECTKPVLRGKSFAIIDGSGDRVQTDVDSYTLGRQERKMKRYSSCVTAYTQVLNSDFESLKGSAQYGLTKDQANTIMGKMKLIQSTIIALED